MAAYVSIIIPVYNGMPYFKKCLESVIKQTLTNIEIIIINDGSTDLSGKYAEEMSQTYKNIKVINQKNHGLYYSRKRGLSEATADYVGWVDADDYIAPTMFEKLYKKAVMSDSDMSYCDYEWIPQKISTKEKWFRDYQGIKNVDFIERNNQPWNKIVKRKLLNDLKIGEMFQSCFDEAYIKVLIHANNPVAVNEKLYYYRVGNGSMSSSYKNIAHYEKFIVASKNLKEKMCDEPEYWQEYFDYRIIYYYLMTMLVAAHANDMTKYNTLKKELMHLPKPYKTNKHIDHILKINFGGLKAFAIKNLIASNFFIAKAMSDYTLK